MVIEELLEDPNKQSPNVESNPSSICYTLALWLWLRQHLHLQNDRAT